MISNIAHFADIHISNDIKRHEEYREQFGKIYDLLRIHKPDRIVISGDLFHDKLQANNECKELAGELLNNLSTIAPVILTVGNHDINIKSLTRVSSTDVLVKLINNGKITYLTKSGFFPDDNVVWVNHSHLQKHINPWHSPKHEYDESKTYIDLFHDPVNACILDNGTCANKQSNRNMVDFKGDYGMFGDIHKFQYLNKQKTYAYCGSAIQQNFGEDTDKHGFMMWDISTGKSELIDVPNDHTLVTFSLNEGCDYDNINFDDALATDKSTFRVEWTDLYSAINLENEEKIKKYIRDKWNDNPIKFKKVKILQDIASSKKLSEAININDKVIQQEIFREYLTINKYGEDFIAEILRIDDVINSRLNESKSDGNITWNIDRFWMDNFKSYSEAEVDWSDIHGIIKIDGKNQKGKSTILDAICYILYGTTLYTNKIGGAKREKNSDNKYINNKRTLDYCSGGAVLDINGAKYTIVRKTERSWSKNKKTISSCSTTVDYYSGLEVSEANKEVDENRMKTQKYIETILGDFEDFVRLSLTTADNLNSLLSIDRATFIDSIIKDAGYDIFEKKLEELKKYKSELTTDDIKLNIDEKNKLFNQNTNDIDIISGEKSLLDECVAETRAKMSVLVKNKESEIKKLNKIDQDIASIDTDSLKEKINNHNISIDEQLNKFKSNADKCTKLKSDFDKESLNNLYKKKRVIDDNISDNKLKISQLNNDIQNERNTIDKVDNKIEDLKNNEITKLVDDIKNINKEIKTVSESFDAKVKEEVRAINDQIKDIQFSIRENQTEINNIKSMGLAVKKEISDTEDSDICLHCNRPYDENHLKHRQDSIDKLKSELEALFAEGKALVSKENSLKGKITVKEAEITAINGGEYTDAISVAESARNEAIKALKLDISGVENIISLVRSGDYSKSDKLMENINKGLTIKKKSLESILSLEHEITVTNAEIDDLKAKSSSHDKELLELENDRDEFNTFTEITAQNNEIKLKVENTKLVLENAKNRLDKYHEQLEAIDKNKLITATINSITDEITEQEAKEKSKAVESNKLSQEIAILTKANNDIQKDIAKYKDQVRRDELLKVYMSCVHRDGIPNMLIMKSKDLINKEISDLLVDCDFDVYLDDDIELKLVSDLTPGVEQSLLSSSGKERTFGAVALKLSLRTINNKSKNNFIFFDEIYGKLDNESVLDFNELLESAKRNMDKIIIIEHHAEIQSDCVFNVTKDNKGISKLEIINY